MAAVPDMDVAEFDDFYVGARDRLARQIAALTGDYAEAADHVQEAFVRAWSQWEKVRRLDDPEGWVRRVAHNLAVSRWRRARRTVLGARVPEPAVEWDDEQTDVLHLLRSLPRHQREAIVAHHLIGQSLAEIATDMGVSESAVKSWLYRGRRTLATALTEPATQEVTPMNDDRVDHDNNANDDSGADGDHDLTDDAMNERVDSAVRVLARRTPAGAGWRPADAVRATVRNRRRRRTLGSGVMVVLAVAGAVTLTVGGTDDPPAPRPDRSPSTRASTCKPAWTDRSSWSPTVSRSSGRTAAQPRTSSRPSRR